jgi:hypothetical protein
MLGEDERRALQDLERRLQAEDIAFVQQFTATAPHPPELTSGALIQIVGALVMAGLMLLAGSMAGTAAFTGVAVAIGLAWWYANEPNGRTDQVS